MNTSRKNPWMLTKEAYRFLTLMFGIRERVSSARTPQPHMAPHRHKASHPRRYERRKEGLSYAHEGGSTDSSCSGSEKECPLQGPYTRRGCPAGTGPFSGMNTAGKDLRMLTKECLQVPHPGTPAGDREPRKTVPSTPTQGTPSAEGPPPAQV